MALCEDGCKRCKRIDPPGKDHCGDCSDALAEAYAKAAAHDIRPEHISVQVSGNLKHAVLFDQSGKMIVLISREGVTWLE